jgi:hypothetical protein
VCEGGWKGKHNFRLGVEFVRKRGKRKEEVR